MEKRNIPFTVLLLLLLVGCGVEGPPGPAGPAGEKGTGTAGDSGRSGSDGNNGQDGVDGRDYAQQVAELVDTLQEYESAILDIQCDSGARGTGFKTSNNRYTTARHVIDGETYCYYYSAGRVLVAEGFGGRYRSIDRDMSFIEPATYHSGWSELPVVPALTDAVLEPGELVMNMSLPGIIDMDVQYVSGTITDGSYDYPDVDPDTNNWTNGFLAQFFSGPGASGSPIFNRDAKVVGVLVGTPDTSNNLVMALKFW